MGSVCKTCRTDDASAAPAAVRRELRSVLEDVSSIIGARKLVPSPAAPGFSGTIGGSAGRDESGEFGPGEDGSKFSGLVAPLLG